MRGVAQPGSALAWGASGRRFKSYRPDKFNVLTLYLSNSHKLSKLDRIKMTKPKSARS